VGKNKKTLAGLIIGIDASNLRDGGGVTHLIEFLRAAQPYEYGISKIVVWATTETLDKIESRSWIIKSYSSILDGGSVSRILWQKIILYKKACEAACDLLFVPGGRYTGRFSPFVTMSRNLLPFEMKELMRFRWSLKTIRLLVLRSWQSNTFRKADGVIFLTQYAKESVLKITGEIKGKQQVISHGISNRFLMQPRIQRPICEYDFDNPYRMLYVSIISPYKHQWNVIEGLAVLRCAGFPVVLHLVGPSDPKSYALLNASITQWDPLGKWVFYHGEIPYTELHEIYEQAELGIFASSCENMPNILLETMIAGLPIACSDRGPMPEVLGDAAIYFDPESPDSIASALLELINSVGLREKLAQLSFERAQQYSWEKCAGETLAFLSEVAESSGVRVSD